MKTIKVYVKEPGKRAEKRMIPPELGVLQELVGGYIETVSPPRAPGVVMICNEEGRLQGLPENCELFGVSFVGPVILAGRGYEDFADVPFTEEALRRMLPQLFDGAAPAEQEETGRRRSVFWYRPAEKTPEEDVILIGVVTAEGKNVCFYECEQMVSYNEEDGWRIDGWPELTDVHVSWWCEPPTVPDEEDLP